jgi:hypothetical protein
MPFGAGFVIAFVVLPAFLGCDVEDDVLAIVLSGFGFCVLSEAADENDFVDYVELGWFYQRDSRGNHWLLSNSRRANRGLLQTLSILPD